MTLPPRKTLWTGLVTLLVIVLGSVSLVAYDYYHGPPKDVALAYVGGDKCIECHEVEYDLWHGSDHDLAMDHARQSTVLGDFDDATFTHIAFDDFLLLSEDELALVLERWDDTKQLAVALRDAKDGLAERIRSVLSDERREELDAEIERLGVVRPCDITTAQRRLTDIARDLLAAGQLEADFAVTTTFFRRGDQFYVTTDGPDGQMTTFEVKYVFGVRPLQQYLVEFPDGRIQCLPTAWDTESKAWYHLYPKEPIPHDDVLHWTGQYQNWNYMCAECHTTNLQKNYDLETDTYRTTWSDIDVNCETCHGPGSLHVQLAEASSFFWDRHHGMGLPGLTDAADSRKVIETCAPCHARRRVVKEGPMQSGGKLLDYYLPEILDNELYYPDGQILEEDYVYGSFIQSRMYAEGVRCIDCHDAHSTKLKFDDNRLCGQCHTPAKYDTVAHHYHPDSSQPGTLCVECHMPETTYMVVDPRRDHSLRIPRPDLTISLGIPNACNVCHDDVEAGETPEWAESWVQKWYQPLREHEHFAYGFAGGRHGDPEAEDNLLETARRNDVRPIIRASALSMLGRYPSDRATAAILSGLDDDEDLIRASAARAMETEPPERLLDEMVPLLRDPIRAVRTEAARVLSRVPRSAMSPSDREAFDAALAEYVASQEAVADQAPAHLNLAVVEMNLLEPRLRAESQRLQQALQGAPASVTDAKREQYQETVRRLTAPILAHYENALRLDPRFIPARANLAMLLDRRGEKAAAEAQFREIIALDPSLAEPYYSLGLLVAEDPDRLEEATSLLAEAAQRNDDNARIRYNLGLALQGLGRLDEAQSRLEQAIRLDPSSVEFAYALALLHIEQEKWESALRVAKALSRMQPNNRQWTELVLRCEAALRRHSDESTSDAGAANPEG